jgi:hypothetical protein
VFVDTAAWIALLDADDGLHAATEQVWHQLLKQRTLLVTSDFVLLELADAFANPGSRKQVIAFINDLWQSPAVRFLPLSRTLLDEGWALYSQRFDKGWGLTDCTSFVVMTQEKITQAFTSDRHFEQAGFTKLL